MIPLHYFLAHVDDRNEPSIKLLEKLSYNIVTRYCGMTEVGDKWEFVETTIEYKKLVTQ